ncbi:unnamed protein product, partial [Iphiclides podalirius]
MFKLVVLSAFLAAVVAEPGFYSPLVPTSYAAIAAPAGTTYLQHSSSYLAPTIYSSLDYPHFIKKRSAEANTAAEDAAPQTTHNKRSVLLADPIIARASYDPAYIASAPLAASYYPGASFYGSYYPSYYSGYPSAFPFIKK